MNTKIQHFIAIPDLVSLMNLSCGFLSILMSINAEFHMASILMIFSLLFDSIDGFVARKTKRVDEYEFGKNIDSLSDIVSFGVAPAVFLYSFGHLNAPFLEIPTILISLFIVICGVLRLSRYNVTSGKVKKFIGYPIPGIAIVMASFYLTGMFNIYIAYILAIIVSLAMICNMEYGKFDNKLILAINCICILIIILNLPVELFSVNIAAAVVLFTSLVYLIRRR